MLELWNKVCKTDPKFTVKANVKGNKITSIKPQYQIKLATEQFGPYGRTWGFRNIRYEYALMEKGLVTFIGEFFFPEGNFVISNSIGIYRDNAQTKIDDDFAKKCETDALTKALSKLGFNSDIFLGQYDDMRYVQEITNEFAQKDAKENEAKQADIQKAKVIPAIIALEKKLVEFNGYEYLAKGEETLKTMSYDELVEIGKKLKEILSELGVK